MALVAVAVYAKVPEAQKLCNAEIKKDKPNMQVVKKECIETAKYYENKKEYGSASWYYLLGGDYDRNINIIKTKLKTESFSIAKIAHSYVLKGDLENAKKLYIEFLKNHSIYMSGR